MYTTKILLWRHKILWLNREGEGSFPLEWWLYNCLVDRMCFPGRWAMKGNSWWVGQRWTAPSSGNSCDGLFLLGLPHKWESMQHNKRWNASPSFMAEIKPWSMIDDIISLKKAKQLRTQHDLSYETKPSTELFIEIPQIACLNWLNFFPLR